MKTRQELVLVVLIVLVSGLFAPLARAEQAVSFERLPAGGVQPQSLVDAAGTVHLVYLTGDARASDVAYTFRAAGAKEFAPVMKVNHQSGNAVAAGTIRGVQVAVGKDGTVHVLWNGSQTATPKQGEGSPLLYARKLPGEKEFEPERNLMTKTYALDGGASLAAGPDGKVYVAWHANPSAKPGKEIDRAAYLAVSSDGGKSFAAERVVSPPKSGACACCGLRLAVDEQGVVDLVFRAAFTVLDRDILWLRSNDKGKSFTVVQRDAWKIGQCPMSTAWLRDEWLAWEANGKVKFTRRDGSVTFAPAGEERRKHPVAVPAADGSTLMLWTEGTGWNKGGAVAWQIMGKDGKADGPIHKRAGLPVWGLATAWASPQSGWVVLY